MTAWSSRTKTPWGLQDLIEKRGSRVFSVWWEHQRRSRIVSGFFPLFFSDSGANHDFEWPKNTLCILLSRRGRNIYAIKTILLYYIKRKTLLFVTESRLCWSCYRHYFWAGCWSWPWFGSWKVNLTLASRMTLPQPFSPTNRIKISLIDLH